MFLTDRDNLCHLLSDVITRRRKDLTVKNSDSATGREKNINDITDAALALNVDDDTIFADMLTFFIGGFHTSAFCELAIVTVPPLCCNE